MDFPISPEFWWNKVILFIILGVHGINFPQDREGFTLLIQFFPVNDKMMIKCAIQVVNGSKFDAMQGSVRE